MANQALELTPGSWPYRLRQGPWPAQLSLVVMLSNQGLTMQLDAHLQDIQSKLKKSEYQNEQAISQGIVLRILSAIEWPHYDTQKVVPEYNINNRRVDFALCIHKNKPVVFIEVKQLGKIIGADKQLFEYAFHQGIQLAIVTDGREWHFYLPAEVGNYDDRRVYKLDLIERDIQESEYRLNRYLGFENVSNGSYLENAREDYKNISKERQAKANIPLAWNKLLDEKDEMLMEIVSEKVESICGYKPNKNQIFNFLSSLSESKIEHKQPAISTNIQPNTSLPDKIRIPIHTKTSERMKIKVIFPDGKIISQQKVADTMVEVIKYIGIEKVRALDIQMYGCPFISNKKLREDKYNWTDTGKGFYIFTHSNTDKKITQLNEINDALSLGLRIEKI